MRAWTQKRRPMGARRSARRTPRGTTTPAGRSSAGSASNAPARTWRAASTSASGASRSPVAGSSAGAWTRPSARRRRSGARPPRGTARRTRGRAPGPGFDRGPRPRPAARTAAGWRRGRPPPAPAQRRRAWRWRGGPTPRRPSRRGCGPVAPASSSEHCTTRPCGPSSVSIRWNSARSTASGPVGRRLRATASAISNVARARERRNALHRVLGEVGQPGVLKVDLPRRARRAQAAPERRAAGPRPGRTGARPLLHPMPLALPRVGRQGDRALPARHQRRPLQAHPAAMQFGGGEQHRVHVRAAAAQRPDDGGLGSEVREGVDDVGPQHRVWPELDEHVDVEPMERTDGVVESNRPADVARPVRRIQARTRFHPSRHGGHEADAPVRGLEIRPTRRPAPRRADPSARCGRRS